MQTVETKLLTAVLGREESLFAAAIAGAEKELVDAVRGSKVLIIGAAGSIGSAFSKQVADYHPEALHLIDIDENGLVEVVRDLHSSRTTVANDFQTFSIGLGGPEFSSFIENAANYDAVVNFAALKHVRAERDPYSMLRMLNTNVVYLDDLLTGLASKNSVKRAFSVSSDKSVNPASAMGSSKTLMEEVLWSHANRYNTSSARFANVAFSAGSLLESFLIRLKKKQPLAAPSDVKRFFISHEEAGQLCLLGAFLGNNREVVYPGLSPQDDMLSFAEIALTVLEHCGYQPLYCETEAAARAAAEKIKPEQTTHWPVYFSTSDTSGEKMYEEFHTQGDELITDRWSNVGVVKVPDLSEARTLCLRQGLDRIRSAAASGQFDKSDLIDILKSLVTGLNHVETGSSLDAKM
jgi:FlaA1/EpsC-like NDP-sugar epimerase